MARLQIGFLSRKDDGAFCLYCRDPDEAPDQVCPGCQAGYHQECWLELGGCGTLGCDQHARSRAAQAPVLDDPEFQPPGEFWPQLGLWLKLVWGGFVVGVILLFMGANRPTTPFGFWLRGLESSVPFVTGAGLLLTIGLLLFRDDRERRRQNAWRRERRRRIRKRRGLS